MILRNAFHGMKSFDAFRDHLEISESVLSARLAKLVKAGVFDRIQSEQDKRQFQYRLTEKGLDLYPVFVALMDWGDKWEPDPNGTRLALIERASGEPILGARVLSQSGTALSAKQVTPLPGPAADDKTQKLARPDIVS